MTIDNDPNWQEAWDSPDELSPERKQALLQGIHRRIAGRRRKRIFFIGGAAVAAVLLFFVLRGSISQSDPSRWILLASVDTPRKLSLEDGSTVWLAPHSALRIHPAFRKHRMSLLTAGTAFFSVAKNEAHAFTVGIGGQQVTVLGTSFAIDRLDSIDLRLTVKEGKVALDNSGGRRLLVGGEEVSTAHAVTGATMAIDTRYPDWWLEQQTRWHNIPLGELLRQVERYYRVKLSYDSTQPDKTVTLTWDRTLRLEENLSVLNSLTGYHIH